MAVGAEFSGKVVWFVEEEGRESISQGYPPIVANV
jgi:hypothetical protein